MKKHERIVVALSDATANLLEQHETTATIAEAVNAFERGECIHYLSEDKKQVWQLTRINNPYNKLVEYAFVCVTTPQLGIGWKYETLTDAITAFYDLYIAPTLSTALNAYDL